MGLPHMGSIDLPNDTHTAKQLSRDEPPAVVCRHRRRRPHGRRGAGGALHVEERDPESDGKDQGGDVWTLVSGNVTGASSGKLWLDELKADIVAVQEHKVISEAWPATARWLRQAGWKSVVAPAEITELGMLSAGVLVGARPHFGLQPTPIQLDGVNTSFAGEIWPHRVAGAWFGGFCRGGITIFSAYLFVNKGLGWRDYPEDNPNWCILGALRQAVEACGTPWAIAADWNVPPSVLEASGWPRSICGLVVAPDEATCVAPPGFDRPGSTIDFWVLDKRLGSQIVGVEVEIGSILRTHRPVILRLRGGARQRTHTVLKAPRPFPAEPPNSPRLRRLCPAVSGEQTVSQHLAGWYDAFKQELCNVHFNIPID